VHFWRRRHDPAILFLFFDELFRDESSSPNSGALRRIAEFVGSGHINITEELLQVKITQFF